MSKAPLIIRHATADDAPALASLLDRRLGPRPIDARRRLWQWRAERNPRRVDSIPGFLVGEQDGRIVAAQGLFPLRFQAGGTVLTASCGADLAADPAARTAGMKLRLKAVSGDISPLHISTSANESANKITMALGGREVPGGRRRYRKALRLEELLSRRLGERFGAVGRASGSIAGWAGTAALAWARSSSRSTRVAGARVERIAQFDDRFTELWSRVAGPDTISVVRDRDYLQWRYADYPFPGIESIGLFAGDDLLGFAVLHLSIDHEGIRFAALLDLCVPPGESNAFAQLAGEAVNRAAAGGAHYVIARAPTREWDSVLRRLGFDGRDLAASPAMYKNNAGIPPEALEREANWYLSLGDGDAAFYHR